MNIAIIGAGPAGIISARNAIKAGHSVVLFEKNTRIGGIWNPWSGGAYRNACMQNSRYTFHYTGFPPGDIDEFPGVEQVFRYLSAVAGEDALRESIRLNTEVVSLRKDAGHRVIRCASEGKDTEDIFDRVIIATGELWQPRRPPLPGEENFSGTLITSRVNRPGFPGECFICELRLPDHRFRWKHNKLFLLLPEEYGPAFPAIVDCYTSPPT